MHSIICVVNLPLLLMAIVVSDAKILPSYSADLQNDVLKIYNGNDNLKYQYAVQTLSNLQNAVDDAKHMTNKTLTDIITDVNSVRDIFGVTHGDLYGKIDFIVSYVEDAFNTLQFEIDYTTGNVYGTLTDYITAINETTEYVKELLDVIDSEINQAVGYIQEGLSQPGIVSNTGYFGRVYGQEKMFSNTVGTAVNATEGNNIEPFSDLDSANEDKTYSFDEAFSGLDDNLPDIIDNHKEIEFDYEEDRVIHIPNEIRLSGSTVYLLELQGTFLSLPRQSEIKVNYTTLVETMDILNIVMLRAAGIPLTPRQKLKIQPDAASIPRDSLDIEDILVLQADGKPLNKNQATILQYRISAWWTEIYPLDVDGISKLLYDGKALTPIQTAVIQCASNTIDLCPPLDSMKVDDILVLLIASSITPEQRAEVSRILAL